jgi:hypothetical protein
VLRAGNELVGRAVVGALNRLDARGREDRVQVRILAGGLGDSAPPWLVRDVDHRGVGLFEPDGGRLARAVGVIIERNLRIEARARPERDREDRSESVDRVEREQHRDLQARFLDGNALKLSDSRWISDAEN